MNGWLSIIIPGGFVGSYSLSISSITCSFSFRSILIVLIGKNVQIITPWLLELPWLKSFVHSLVHTIWDRGQVWVQSQSGFQYGCQMCILDFWILSISQELSGLLICNLHVFFIQIRFRSWSFLETNWHQIWLPGRHLGLFVSAQYLKKPLSHWYEMLQVYLCIWDKWHVWFWNQSLIQYGC